MIIISKHGVYCACGYLLGSSMEGAAMTTHYWENERMCANCCAKKKEEHEMKEDHE